MSKKSRRVPVVLALAVTVALIPNTAGAAGPVLQATPGAGPFLDLQPGAQLQWAGTPRDIHEQGRQMLELQSARMSKQVPAALDREMVVRLSADEQKRIDQPGVTQGRFLVGVEKPLDLRVSLARARTSDRPVGLFDPALGAGAADVTSKGGLTWTFALRVPGATALRLHLTGLDLPVGAELYVYNDAASGGQAFGPYTGRGPNDDGDFYTNTVFGEQILLQLEQVEGAATVPSFRVAGVGVMGQRFVAPSYKPAGVFPAGDQVMAAAASNLCSFNADCIVNAACTSSAAVNDAKEAVASILFASGGSFFICTGGLIAHNGDNNVIPYFLTAHHCIGTSSEASSLETYFDYSTTCNSPNCTQPYNNIGETVGATLLATGSSSDYSLVRLSATPVSANGITAYLGWTSANISGTTTSLFRISHPQGAPQAYSEQRVDPTAPTCGGLPRGSFLYSRDTLGATEGGSSGSPVVNGSGQIVGQLLGACGTNLNNVCDAVNNATVDGAFAASFPNLTTWLDPGSGGGGTCGARGDSCSTNSDCCSNRCRRRFSGGTCR